MNFIKAIVAAGLVAASTSAYAADITGAGSTFIYPVLSKWADAYKKESGNGVNYQSIGSGAGIKQIQAKTVTFGATDMPLKVDQLEKDGSGAVADGHGRDRSRGQYRGREGRRYGAGRRDARQDLRSARSPNGMIRRSRSSIRSSACRRPPSPSCTVRTARARPSTSPTIFPRSAPTGNRRSVSAPRSNGRSASAPRATKAFRVTSARPRTRSVTSNTPMPSRTS